MDMTPKKRALLCVTGNKWKADHITSFVPLTAATVEQMEQLKVYWPEAHRNPEQMAKLAAGAYEIIGLDGFKIPFDLCLGAEALGCSIDYGVVDRQPSITKPAFESLEDFKIPENIMEQGRFPVVDRALDLLREKYGDLLALSRQIVGPITLAGHLFGVENFCKWIKRKDPEIIKDVLMTIAELNVQEAKHGTIAGSDIICIADPTASSDILSPQTFKELVVPAYQLICSKSPTPVVLHICGNASAFLPYLPDTGIDTFSCDANVDVGFAKMALGDRVTVMGNVFTINPLLMGTPEGVREAAMNCIVKGTDVLAPSCGVPPRTPTENFKVLPEVAKCMVYI
jgi:MtaA/CmuA family methyltransferase